MPPEQTLFSLKNVTCARGGRVLFQNFSLSLQAGEVLQLQGANGVGKTSLLRILAGRLETQDFSESKNTIFLPADDRALKIQETAAENLAFWRGLWGGGDVDAVLGMSGLSDLKDTRVRLFSAGQKRRLSLARVYLSGAKLWLLDEPLNGLDAASRTLFFQNLAQHAAKGGGAVIATHDDIPGATKKLLEAA